MFNSRVTTINVPSITATASETTPSPAEIVHCAAEDLLVRVRNNSFGVFVLISYEVAALTTFPSSADVWQTPAGGVDTFVVAKGQGLYVSTPGGLGAVISVAVSRAVPVEEFEGPYGRSG